MKQYSREILAGLSTFFTVAYLLLLYPKILSVGGIDFGAALTATIAIIVIGTLFLALYADFPVLLAPGLSVGPYLVYSVILKEGATWQTALGIVFWVGVAIFLLTLFKIRQKIILHLPPAIKSASISGIGLFLICVALKDLGVLVPSEILFRFGTILSLPNLIAFCGLSVFFLLYHFQIRGAFLIAMIGCWMISLLLHLTVWKGFAALPSSLGPTLFQLDLYTPLTPRWIGTVLSILLISLFDSTASLTVLAKLSHRMDRNGRIQNIDRILVPDGTCSMIAALLGTGTLSYALESSSGIKAGGRTGLTAIVAALCCSVCLFLFPLISSIPLFATAPALIAIGIFMALEAVHVKWTDCTESLPALLTLLTIPLTFSIYQGFAFGFISFALLKALNRRWKEVHPICWALSGIFAAHLLWPIIV